MADTNLVFSSFRGGMNNTDPAMSLSDDQCVLAENIEFYRSMLGERRRGTDGIDLTGAGFTTEDRVTFLHRYLPSKDESLSELWALGCNGEVSSRLVRKDTAWHAVTVTDAILLTDRDHYEIAAQNLHGKMFLAYKSMTNRLHVWDGTTLRLVGLARPSAAPTGANTGVGTFASTRYYRIRYTVQAAGVTIRRSEASDVLTFTPSGAGTGVIVTKPVTISENETHWELEASVDNADFYVIATTIVATPTVTDTQPFTSGYAAIGTLSEESGNYLTIPSAKYLTADEDRLVVASDWDDETLASRVSWTTVYNDPGVGNDERIPIATTNFANLDGYEGGGITGISHPIGGAIFAFKVGMIFKMVRTGDVENAYDIFPMTKSIGAIPGSLVHGIDETGAACIYFVDRSVGPCRAGANGVQICGFDIYNTWKTVNTDAAVVCKGCYYPDTRQVHWWVSVGAGVEIPNYKIILQTNLCRTGIDGVRKGWTVATTSDDVTAVCMYSDNIDTGLARSKTLRPFIGVVDSSLIQRCDVGNDDNGTVYAAHAISKPVTMTNILNRFGITAASLLGTAHATATLRLALIRDFGIETISKDIAFIPVSTETQVIVPLDHLVESELHTAQIEFRDTPTAHGGWEVNQVALALRQEEVAG